MNSTQLHPPQLPRRDFIKFMGVAATAVASVDALSAPASATAPRISLGLDAHSVRAMGWKARQLIDYAAELKLDAALFNTLKPLEIAVDKLKAK